MIPPTHLESTLDSLLAGHADLVFYGHKSWGRTELMLHKLDTIFGVKNYLYVNSALVWDRNSFFFVLNSQICRIMQKFDSETQILDPLRKKLAKDEDYYQNNDQWAKMMNFYISSKPDLFRSLKRIYILIDNIEELIISSEFFKAFYKICKQQLASFKFTFIFTGNHLKGKQLSNQEPFKRMICLFMPRPSMEAFIVRAVEQAQNWEQGNPNLKKFKQSIISHLYMKLQIVENDYERIKQISTHLTKLAVASIHGNYDLIKGFLRRDGLHGLSKDLIESGTIISMIGRQDAEKEGGLSLRVQGNIRRKSDIAFQKYPNLILCGLFLANGYHEHDDRRRFAQYRRKRAKVVKNRKINTSANSFKRNETILRHNYSRIHAICESLEDQADKFLPESQLPHHTLDYYGCFEYLKEEKKLENSNKLSKNHWGKLIGDANENQVKQFLRSINLKISQFTDLED